MSLAPSVSLFLKRGVSARAPKRHIVRKHRLGGASLDIPANITPYLYYASRCVFFTWEFARVGERNLRQMSRLLPRGD